MKPSTLVPATSSAAGIHTGAGPSTRSSHAANTAPCSAWWSSNGCSGRSTSRVSCCHAFCAVGVGEGRCGGSGGGSVWTCGAASALGGWTLSKTKLRSVLPQTASAPVVDGRCPTAHHSTAAAQGRAPRPGGRAIRARSRAASAALTTPSPLLLAPQHPLRCTALRALADNQSIGTTDTFTMLLCNYMGLVSALQCTSDGKPLAWFV